MCVCVCVVCVCVCVRACVCACVCVHVAYLTDLTSQCLSHRVLFLHWRRFGLLTGVAIVRLTLTT